MVSSPFLSSTTPSAFYTQTPTAPRLCQRTSSTGDSLRPFTRTGAQKHWGPLSGRDLPGVVGEFGTRSRDTKTHNDGLPKDSKSDRGAVVTSTIECLYFYGFKNFICESEGSVGPTSH